MIDDIKEELKEVSANLHIVSAGIEHEDNKEIISNALLSIVRSLDRIVDEIENE